MVITPSRQQESALNPLPIVPPLSGTFRIGDADLNVSGDQGLLSRFHTILGDCAAPADRDLPLVRCDVAMRADVVEVTFHYPNVTLDIERFFRDFPSAAESLRQVSGDTLRFDRRGDWQGAAANCAINVTVAIQRHAFFFHAASVDVAGRGVLLAGGKMAGKSTTSLALAARGHRLLGDEIAALRTATRELLPFPRAVSIRSGVRSARLNDRLASVPLTEETYPDGGLRLRVRVSDLFSLDPRPVPLSAIFFLRPFAEETRIEAIQPGLHDAAQLEPLASSFWGDSAAHRRFELLQLLGAVRCFALAPGAPDAAAECVERFMEAA
jgi:hypothetical protein